MSTNPMLSPYTTTSDKTYTVNPAYPVTTGYAALVPEVPKPKYPGHWCQSYDEFRKYVKQSTNVPEWVKEAFASLDGEDDIWQVEMWAGILSEWQGRRVSEIREATNRLTK